MLGAPEKDKILLRLLSQGRGSLEFARDILEDTPDNDPSEPGRDEENPEWCICTVCRMMPLEIENVKNLCNFVHHLRKHVFG